MFPFGRFMKVHSFDVGSLYSASHRATGAGVDGTNAPCFSVVLHEMRAGEGGLLEERRERLLWNLLPVSGSISPEPYRFEGP